MTRSIKSHNAHVRDNLTLSLLIILLLVFAPTVYAFSLGMGLAAVEEGNDRTRPAAALDIDYNDDYFSRAYYYGHSYSIVTQQTYLFGLGKSIKLPNHPNLKAGVGLFGLNEDTLVKAKDPDSNKSFKIEHATTGGMFFGLYANLLRAGYFTVDASWEGYLVPVSVDLVSGLLATGRKQFFALTIGGAI